jgi:hypothetical protein
MVLARTRARLVVKIEPKFNSSLLGISLNTLRTRSENHIVRTIETKNLELFDPIAQDTTGFHYNKPHSIGNFKIEERTNNGEIKSGRLAPASVEVNGKTRLGAVHATG